MTYPIRVSHNLWETPEISAINRLPMHSARVPFRSADEARAYDRSSSSLRQSLDGDWKFKLLERPEAAEPGMLGPDMDDTGWDSIAVPGNWTTQGFADRPIYTNAQMPWDNTPPIVPEANPTGIYRTTIEVGPEWRERRTVLYFGGVESYYEVFVNGRFIGMAKDSRLPSEFDISEALQDGANTLAVKVIRWSDGSYVEDQDHWWQAGIHRHVYLYTTALTYLQDVWGNGDLDLENGDGLLCVKTHTCFPMSGENWESGPEQDHEVRIELIDNEGNPLFTTSEPIPWSYHEKGYRNEINARVAGVAPWSHEQPTLYRLIVSLLDSEGNLLDVRCVRVGFRNVSIKNQELRINGKAVLIKGVNRHDHHDRYGKHVPHETMMEDIRLLKQFNFNAVRTSHYPNDERWYDLCDEHGILLVDECNIECHANYNTLCRDPRWSDCFYERAMRMVHRDKNHPSIFAWSSGNESGNGDNHLRFIAEIRQLDPSRIIHHEGDMHARWNQSGRGLADAGLKGSDVINPMYTSLTALREWADTNQSKRPLILCEYSHAMGNSNGNLKEYWELFENCHGLQGGFIWDWVDQGLLISGGGGEDDSLAERHAQCHTPGGKWYWGYGGDFDEKIHDFDFCINGMIWPDRTPHPGMYEFKKLVQPVAVEPVDLACGSIRVRNKQDYTTLGWLEGWWELLVDGVRVQTGDVPTLDIGPGLSADVTIDVEQPAMRTGQECHLTVHYRVREKTAWCEAGHELAWEQLEMPYAGSAEAAPTPLEPIACGVEDDSVALTVDGANLLARLPELNMWRACTDNDGIRRWSGQQNKPMGQWQIAGLNELQLTDHSVAATEASVAVERTYVGTDPEKPIRHCQVYTALEDGSVRIDNTIEVDTGLPSLPRIGVILQTLPGFEHLEWFGRGPHENYIDRNAGAAVGRYRSTVAEQYVPYILPQENGNKTNVRWFSLDNGERRITFQSLSAFEFSVHHATPADLFGSLHTNEVPHRDETVVSIDHIQRGLGTGSCGPQTEPEYCVEPGNYAFSYLIRVSRI